MCIEDLYGAFYKEMLCYCTSLTKNKSAAEDLVQESYIKAMTHWDDLMSLNQNQCRAWLYKTARNLFIDQFRKQTHESPLKEDQLSLTTFEEDFSEAAVAQLIGRLPEKERTLFSLRYFEGYNSKELGEIFSLPPATVRARLSSAKRRMREWLKN